jgi:NAD(P)-dependent dehydrogenase (short-subunit alcohol dehydrogenase family)
MQGFVSPNIEQLALDVTSDDAVEHVVQTILEKEGKIDIAVNNAGILAIGKVPPPIKGSRLPRFKRRYRRSSDRLVT